LAWAVLADKGAGGHRPQVRACPELRGQAHGIRAREFPADREIPVIPSRTQDKIPASDGIQERMVSVDPDQPARVFALRVMHPHPDGCQAHGPAVTADPPQDMTTLSTGQITDISPRRDSAVTGPAAIFGSSGPARGHLHGPARRHRATCCSSTVGRDGCDDRDRPGGCIGHHRSSIG
jgi:hypothetical protein